MAARKYHIHIQLNSTDEMKEELRELAYIMAGLRNATRIWQTEFGSVNRNAMKFWEEKADAWISKHKIYFESTP